MVNSNITGNQSTLDESTMSNQQNPRVSVPVHTQHVVHTTTTTTISSSSQRNPLQIGQIRGPQDRGGASTQVVFSTCQILHPGQHTAIRAVTNDNIRGITAVPTAVASTGAQFTTMATTNSHQTAGALYRNIQQNAVTRQNFLVKPTEQNVGGQLNLATATPYAQAGQMGISTQQNTQVLPILPATGGIQHPQQVTQPQYHRVRGELPLPQQMPEENIIRSIQALRTTAVNQDLMQQRLTQLQQEALPQATGNAAYNHTSIEPNRASTNVKKGKKEKIEVVWPQDCAFAGHLRACVTYEQLTQSQFVLGF